MTEPVATRAAAPDLDRWASLAPNAWLRYDVISRLLPAGVEDVLEIGCGQGAVGARLAQRYRYTAVEPDPTSYAVARERFTRAGAGDVHNAGIEAVGDRRFDLVCAFEVLEHLEDDAGALKEWAGRLRPGGWVLLSMPANQRRYGPWDELVGHFRRYEPESLTALLHRCGFTDVTIRMYGMPLGYALETVRNAVGRRRLAQVAGKTVDERTAQSGRLLQPSGTKGVLTRWGTAPFRAAQRAFPGTGTGLVVRARLAA